MGEGIWPGQATAIQTRGRGVSRPLGRGRDQPFKRRVFRPELLARLIAVLIFDFKPFVSSIVSRVNRR